MTTAPRRRWSFSLRTLFIVVAALGIAAGLAKAYPVELALFAAWAVIMLILIWPMVAVSRIIEARKRAARQHESPPPPATMGGMSRKFALYAAFGVLLILAFYFAAIGARGNPWEKDNGKRLVNTCVAFGIGAAAYATFRWAQTIDAGPPP